VSWPICRRISIVGLSRIILYTFWVDELSTWARIYYIAYTHTHTHTHIYLFIHSSLSRTACIHSRFPQTARTNLAMVHAVLSPDISFFFTLFLSICVFPPSPSPRSFSIFAPSTTSHSFFTLSIYIFSVLVKLHVGRFHSPTRGFSEPQSEHTLLSESNDRCRVSPIDKLGYSPPQGFTFFSNCCRVEAYPVRVSRFGYPQTTWKAGC